MGQRKIFAHTFNAFKMTLIKCTPVWRSEAGLGSSHNVGPGDQGPGDRISVVRLGGK